MAALRVAIADDSALMREGVARVLADAGFEVVAQSENAVDLMHAIGSLKPDVAVIDIRMPPTHTDEGVRAARRIREAHPGVGVVVLSQHAEPEYAMELLSEGTEGVGYLLKDRIADIDDFAESVRRVAQGGSALDPSIVGLLVARKRRSSPLEVLSAREREVLGPDGRGPLQPGHRRRPRGHPAGDREAHHEHLREARAGQRGRGSPPRARRADVPARELARAAQRGFPAPPDT